MKNLKFRAWDKRREDFRNDIFVDTNGNLYQFSKNTGYGQAITYLDNKHIVLMQSTGFFDKNGKEIFEGDIIDVGTRIPFLNKIQRDEKTAYLKLVPLDKRWTESYFTNFEDKSRYEVIGNIYEDKELLENE